MTYLEQLHKDHKDRRARLIAAAVVQSVQATAPRIEAKVDGEPDFIALRAENISLRQENEWLKSLISNLKTREIRIDLPQLSMRMIADAVVEVTGIPFSEISGPKRQFQIRRARQLCYFIMSKYTTKSFPQIGGFLDRDHTSVLHGVDMVVDNIKLAAIGKAKDNYSLLIPRILEKLGINKDDNS
jgi:chromosomal replication initiation ATPase DnaA